MKDILEVNMLIDDYIGLLEIDTYSNDIDINDKFTKRTKLEYSTYLQYELDRLDSLMEVADFLDYEYNLQLEDSKTLVKDEERVETKMKIEICQDFIDMVNKVEDTLN